MPWQVLNWNDHFENAKSRTITQKTWAVLPNKQDGLGYCTLITGENGPAIYGAWCAQIIVLSKQRAPRNGWLTQHGQPDGVELSAADMEMKTRIPAMWFDALWERCERLGWMAYEGEKPAPKASRPRKTRPKPASDARESTISPEDVYEAYPRKAARPAAIRAIKAAMKRCDADTLLERSKMYASAMEGVEKKFIPHPATWYGQERYNDDPSEWNPNKAPVVKRERKPKYTPAEKAAYEDYKKQIEETVLREDAQRILEKAFDVIHLDLAYKLKTCVQRRYDN